MSKPKLELEDNVTHDQMVPLDLQTLTVERRLQWISDIQESLDAFPQYREIFLESIRKIQASFN